MSVSEYDRHQVFQWFEESMGPQRAATVMQMLPQMEWTEVTTKKDLLATAQELRAEMSAMEARILAQNRTLFLGTLASNATLVGLVLAVLRLS